MRQIKMLFVFLCLFFINQAVVAGEGGGKLEGKIEGITKPTKVVAVRHVGEYGLDTVSAVQTNEKGEFVMFFSKKDLNEHLDLKLEGVRAVFSFFSEEGTFFLTGDKSNYSKTKVWGTPENIRWNAYQQYMIQYGKAVNEITFKRKEIGDSASRVAYASLDGAKKRYIDSLIQANPQSVVALHLAKIPLPMLKYYQIDSVLAHFKPYFSKHKYYAEMKKRADILRKVAPGAMAPNFTALKPDGKTKISLSSFKGKYVLLDFWASWCVPCRAENVHTKELYEKYKQYGLEIVSFSLDSDLKAWQDAIAKDGITWQNASDLTGGKNSKVAQLYGIDGLPAIWIIDPNGKIIAESVRGEALDKLLNSVLVKK